jgi:hypothetical protein
MVDELQLTCHRLDPMSRRVPAIEARNRVMPVTRVHPVEAEASGWYGNGAEVRMSKHLAIRRKWRRARRGSEPAAGLKLDPGGLGLVVRT